MGKVLPVVNQAGWLQPLAWENFFLQILVLVKNLYPGRLVDGSS